MASTTFSNSNSVSYLLPAGFCASETPLILMREGASSPPSEADNSLSQDGYNGWQTCAESGSISFLTSSQGSKTIYLWTKDVAGNISSSPISDSIEYDTLSPAAPTLTIQDDADDADSGYTNSLDVDVTLSSCADIAAINLSTSATDPGEGGISTACSTSTDNYQFSLSGSDGSKTIYLWVKDQAGNRSFSSGSIIVDRSVPVLSSEKITAMLTDSVSFTWSTNETIPTRIKWGTSIGAMGTSNTPGGNFSSHSFTVDSLLAGTEYFFQMTARDQAGNVSDSIVHSAVTLKVVPNFGSSDSSYIGYTAAQINSSDNTLYGGGRKQVVACDLNNDGLDDLVYGDPAANVTRTKNGAVYVKFSVASPSTSYLLPSQADITYFGSANDEGLGRTLYCLDMDGDGIDELGIGSSILSGEYFYTKEGSSGISTGPIDFSNSGNYNFRFTGPSGNNFGIASVGKINNDVYSDLLLCVMNSVTATTCRGFFGAPSPDNTSDFTLNPTCSISGENVNLADVNQDGLDDVLLGCAGHDEGASADAGAILIFKGGNLSGTDTAHDWFITTTTASTYLASAIPGDLNNDGKVDFVVRRLGTQEILTYNSYILWGKSDAEWNALAGGKYLFNTSTQLKIESNKTKWGSYGHTATHQVIGDINADGKPDLIVNDIDDNGNRGRVCVFLNRSITNWNSLATSTTISLSSGDICYKGADANDYFGSSIAIGNLDGSPGPNSQNEILISAPQSSGENDAGSFNGEIYSIFGVFPSIGDKVQINFGSLY